MTTTFPKMTGFKMLVAAGAFLSVAQTASAQTPEEFYKGRTISLIIPNEPGGSFDLSARLVSSHIGRFIPGNPSIIPQNMPGAAGMRAANYLASVAAKDGSVMAMLVPNIQLAQVLGVPSIAYDTRQLNWIGRAIASTAVLFTWHTSGTRTLADLKTRETLMAGTGPLSQAELKSIMLNGVVGTRFRVISGYKGSAEAALAVERGEAEGTLLPWQTISSVRADWLKEKKINIVARYVRRPIPERPDVPSVYDLAETEQQRNLLRLFLGADEMGHPIAMPPGVPRDRVEVVRKALMTMVDDPAFLADVKKRNLTLVPGAADELEKIVAEAFEATPGEIELARKYYKQ